MLSLVELENSNYDLVQSLKSMEMEDCFHLLGPQDSIQNIINGLDILASCSTTEGFPNVVAEAMACGTLCVTTNAGDSALIVGDDKWVVEVGDYNAMSNAWGKYFLLSDGEKRALKKSIRQKIVDRYSIAAVSNVYSFLYNEFRN